MAVTTGVRIAALWVADCAPASKRATDDNSAVGVRQILQSGKFFSSFASVSLSEPNRRERRKRRLEETLESIWDLIHFQKRLPP